MTMKQNPPIMPNTIQVEANCPSGIKKAPIIPPITIRYLMPQKLEYKTYTYTYQDVTRVNNYYQSYNHSQIT